jgi:UDP-N-acetylglucosamine 4,6-dehydratase
MNDFFLGSTVAITGGTGSLGSALSRYLVENTGLERLVIISRRWQDQKKLQRELNNDSRLRFFIGNVRDRDRMEKALNGVNYLFAASAFKDVPWGQYNPEEMVKTNIIGSMNTFDAAISCGVERVLFISSDKACSPINIYGTTKATAEHLTTNWNAYGAGKTFFSTVRYGNVLGSSGSVVPLFKKQAKEGKITLTSYQATRFWIRMEDAVQFVVTAMTKMKKGEIFIPKLKSSYVYDLASVIAPDANVEEIGLRPGEKLHEVMISQEESRLAVDLGWAYAILPPSYEYDFGNKIYEYRSNGKEYSSLNAEKYSKEELRKLIE